MSPETLPGSDAVCATIPEFTGTWIGFHGSYSRTTGASDWPTTNCFFLFSITFDIGDNANMPNSPVYAPFFGAMGCTAAIVFTCFGAAYGTAKSGVGIVASGVLRPDLIVKSTPLHSTPSSRSTRYLELTC